MILRSDPLRMPEPPPAEHDRIHVDRAGRRSRADTTHANDARPMFGDALALAAEIARPALRLTAIAAALLLTALMYRLGASMDPEADRLWGAALTGLATLGLLELPPYLRRGRGAPGEQLRDALPGRVAWADRAIIRAARRWASLVTLLAMASVALLVAAVAAGPRATMAHCGIAILGVLVTRAFLLVEGTPAEPRRRGADEAAPIVERRSRLP